MILGRWVRQYDGYINVQYFGVAGTGGEYSAAFQNALNFAFLNTSDVGLLKSSTSNTLGGVSMQSNSFLVEKLGYTFGVMQTIPISGTTLNSGNNKIVFINGSSQPVIDIIKSDINAGEYLIIRVQNGSISVKNTENIVFLTTNIDSKFTLINGESATFVKIDNNILESDGVTIKYRGTYQLISILKTLSWNMYIPWSY